MRVRKGSKAWLLVLLLPALALTPGCEEEESAQLPDPLLGAYLWNSISLAGVEAEIWSEAAPQRRRTTYFLYFPHSHPSDPVEATVTGQLRLTEIHEDVSSAVFDSLPDDYILNGPCLDTLLFQPSFYLFEGYIAPYIEGEWTLELTWRSLEVTQTSYFPLTVATPEDAAPLVIPAGTWNRMVVLDWLDPREPPAGSGPYRFSLWRSRQGGQVMAIDSTFTVTLKTVLPEPSVLDSSEAEWSGGFYRGDLRYSNLRGWRVDFRVYDMETLLGNGSLHFGGSDHNDVDPR